MADAKLVEIPKRGTRRPPARREPPPQTPVADYAAPHSAAGLDVPIAWVAPSNFNPRRLFDPEALAELAASITLHGLLEPIVVREVAPAPDGPRFEILAGERRYRACLLAGLTTVAVRILRDIDDRTALEITIVENLQRRDLDAIEQAAGFAALATAGMTQTAIAAAVKVHQGTIAKSLGLLRLPADVQELIRVGTLTASHGEALLPLAAWPLVVSAVAAKAVAEQTTTKVLRADPLAYPWPLQSAGVIRFVGHGAFDKAICDACPFGAFRAAVNGWSGYCLNPLHYDELETAAKRAQLRETNRAIQEAKRGGASIPKLKNMAHDSYELIHTAPAGCDAACPCRGQALQDGELVTICTDPARHKKLKDTAARATKKVKREAMRAQLAALTANLQGLEAITSRELAVIVFASLRYATLGPVLKDAAAAHIAEYGVSAGKPELDFLAALEPLALVRFTVHLLLGSELHASLENDYMRTPAHDWYEAHAPAGAKGEGE